MEEAMSDPQSAIGEMQGMVHAELLGRTPVPLEQRKAEMAALDARAVAAALKVALDSAIVIIPINTRSPRPHYPPYPRFDARPLPGAASPSAYGTGEQVVVGPHGIALCDPDRRALNIKWPEVAVTARWDDGTRLLIGHDGTEILFRPPAWRNTKRVLGAIDANVPPDRVIQADSPSPSADLPAAPPVPRRGSVLAGRGPMLLVAAGLALALVAGVALLGALR
jgi:hypothetical protein